MKTRRCDECSKFRFVPNSGKYVFICGHNPRFYNPKTYGDDNFGWKRKCEDFKARKGEK